jgi:MraZ protein
LPLFLGRFDSTLDDKGRIVLPSKFRKEAGEEASQGFVVSPSIDPCLEIRTRVRFERWAESIIDEPTRMDREARDWERDVFGPSELTKCDKQGRLPLPAELVEEVGITKDVKVVGLRDYIQVWDRARWAADEERRRNNRADRHTSLFARPGQRATSGRSSESAARAGAEARSDSE